MKYILEIKPEYEDSFKGLMILGAKDSNLFVDTLAVENLEELNSDYINEHYGGLQDEAYHRGLAEGKKAFDLLDAERDSEYQRGLSEGNDIGYKDGVKDGQNEAWECAKKLFSTMSETEIEKVFPTEWENGFYGLMQMKPQYAIERLKSYEDDKIKRGDIVNVKGSCNDDLLGVVTKVREDNCYIVWGDGSGGAWSKKSVVKTGKHIDVDKFLGGVSNDD